MTRDGLFVATAGWSIPRPTAHRFDGDGTHLQRYARVLRGAEINSSFHRPHAPAVYARWAAGTPPDFRFAVKLPRAITHDQKLRRARAPLERFLAEIAGLGGKCGPLLVQLPPSLAFDRRMVSRFFELLRALHGGEVVCEPRHPSWFTAAADAVLIAHRIARAAADPAPAERAERPGGWPGLVYYRLHGSPRKYWSRYSTEYVTGLAQSLGAVDASIATWCVFDNTASGAALDNALEVADILEMPGPAASP